jgi:hypothetical protein
VRILSAPPGGGRADINSETFLTGSAVKVGDGGRWRWRMMMWETKDSSLELGYNHQRKHETVQRLRSFTISDQIDIES